MNRSDTILNVESLTRRFGGLIANDRIDMAVQVGEIRALIGPNGAGKTTFLNVITGFYVPSEGRVTFVGSDITRQPTHVRARLGMARTFQTIRLFHELTALENVMAARTCRSHVSLLQVALGLKAAVAEEADIRDRSLAALATVGLEHRAHLASRHLPYGEQRLLEIARALATEPRLLLLDEPVAGMNQSEVNQVAAIIRRIRDAGVAVLLVEHNMRVVMEISDRVTVMDFGRRIAEGTPDEVRRDATVIDAYLGKVTDNAAV